MCAFKCAWKVCGEKGIQLEARGPPTQADHRERGDHTNTERVTTETPGMNLEMNSSLMEWLIGWLYTREMR